MATTASQNALAGDDPEKQDPKAKTNHTDQAGDNLALKPTPHPKQKTADNNTNTDDRFQ